jgi:hypothetical protein
MAKRTLNEQEVKKFLEREGFRELKETDKQTEWYKVASQRPICFEKELNEVTHKYQISEYKLKKK